MRKIELAYFEEDPNTRVFKNKFLHQDIKENRGYILSAIASIYRNWADQGFPKGTTPFVSFPQWAEVVGGVMMAAGLGDPCLPFKGEYDNVGGDKETSAMTELVPGLQGRVRRRMGRPRRKSTFASTRQWRKGTIAMPCPISGTGELR